MTGNIGGPGRGKEQGCYDEGGSRPPEAAGQIGVGFVNILAFLIVRQQSVPVLGGLFVEDVFPLRIGPGTYGNLGKNIPPRIISCPAEYRIL